ncbi:MAG: DoxX family protein [Proteobacteria bacterium]|nr:DoxX family protein [Pseudomonadota bacterium]
MAPRFGADGERDGLLLASRILLMLLFVIFGWEKLIGFSGTVGYFAQLGLPEPPIAALIAVVMEFFVGLAIVVGAFTRPLAILLAIYTIATALIGHHFWTLSGMARMESEINFFKNVSITGGLILLYVTGAGRYSVDARMNRAD